MWLSNEFTPFQTDLGVPYVPLDFTVGLPTVRDWPKQTGDTPWILDPAEHPRPAVQSHHKSASLSSGDEKRKKRKKKKHCRAKKLELKVTTQGQGDDTPIWSQTRSNLSSGSDLQTEADSGIGSYQKPQNDAGSTTRQDHTPRYSPNTIRRLEEGDLGDAPLSDRGRNSDDDQEMVSVDDGVEEAMGTNPVWPPGQGPTITSPDLNLVVAPEVPLLADPADTDDEKACRDAFQLLMQGFHTATHTLSNEYQ